MEANEQIANGGDVPQQNPNFSTPPSESPKSFGPKFFLLLGFIILVFLGIYVLFLSWQKNQEKNNIHIDSTQPAKPIPTSGPTDNWKTYSNPSNYYTFKYPGNWIIKNDNSPDSDNGKDTYLQSLDYTVVTPSPNPREEFGLSKGNDLRIDTLVNKPYKNFDDYKNFIINSSTSYFPNRRETTISGQPALCYTNTGELYKRVESSCKIIYKGLFFSLTMESYQNSDSLFNQILSTFKFTDSQTSVDTSTWKTYGNTSDSNQSFFTLNYPPTWSAGNSQGTSYFFVDPSTKQQKTGNGGSTINYWTQYVFITKFVTTETVKQFVDRITSGPEYTGVDPERSPIAISNYYSGEIYKASGENSQGYNIAISNGSYVTIINVPNKDINSDEVISKMLATFAFK